MAVPLPLLSVTVTPVVACGREARRDGSVLMADTLAALRARSLRKLEAEQTFIANVARMAADHVTDVQLGHLVVAQVDDRIARTAQRLQYRFFLLPSLAQTEPDEDVRSAVLVVAVVEFRDAALAHRFGEVAQPAFGQLCSRPLIQNRRG